MKSPLLAGFAALCLSGCAGYSIGPVKPNYLSEIKTIAVSTFRNETLLPRIEALTTSTVIKQFQQDGTYQITSDEKADAILTGIIYDVRRSPARSIRGNVLATREFKLALRLRYTLVRRTGGQLTRGVAAGTTSFFVGSDVTTDERQALPLAIEDLATSLVSQLSEGW